MTVGVERLGPQTVTRLFLRQAEVGLRRHDPFLVGMNLGAHHLSIGQRQRRSDAIETIGGAVVDLRDRRQRHFAGIAEGDRTRRADKANIQRQRHRQQPARADSALDFRQE